ncbi:ribosome hibernation-promoting factor, HPF/YfiA family [Moraxella sp. VT-16-12]|uniref:ribosome hibernation-promoting factor, HPF/YfiA family n=1 Tax=Moraxella sp. VT-16-12 TaxID=2014877 RepID=UPI000B7F8C60|nr:ribosome-associated translation inhibitor RaiA [Moraxella sp. VT-16-12]TWV84687.1 ribosome-associated translation inhibitor RaiA [Moraxella sp. VT-16-12]
MNIFIKSHHLDITDKMNQEVHDKLDKCTRHFDQIQSIHVTLSKDGSDSQRKDAYKAEAILRVAGQEMFVKSSADDIYHAIGDMADMLTRQVRKHKTRLERQGVKHRGRHVEMSDTADVDLDDVELYEFDDEKRV